MSTEVQHGGEPIFRAKTHGCFDCYIVGHYTDMPDLGAGGVKFYLFESQRPEKRRAELLVLRTAFLDWFIGMYQTFGGTRDEALGQIEYVVDRFRGFGANQGKDGR